MKYKLINKTTQEEHLCDKVVVDGFDCYVSDKKIIATNNPNSYLPKVVDEIDIGFETYQGLPVRFKTNSTQWINGFSFCYNKSQETHPFSEDDMIEFGMYRLQVLGTPYENYSTKELLQLWKDQQIKTVYYE